MRIGLVAMSGIRVCDAELLRLGLTLPGFVERSKVIASLPSLGLLTLAGMTPSRHQMEYVEMPALPEKDELRGLLARFDLVAISTYSAQVDEAYSLAGECRAAGVPSVMGGPHVTVLPGEAGEHCSSVVVGEGEAVWPRVLADAERGKLDAVYGSRDGGFDLSDAPMPSFHLLDMGKYNRLTVQTSRGCPHRCEFCASSVLMSARYKQKPAGKVLAEIDAIRAAWEHPFIEFADDNTFVDREYWKDLLPELARRKVHWFTETDVSVAEDPDLLRLMREAGCAQVLIGLESPTEEALEGVETRSNWKRRKYPAYREAVKAIQSHGISVNGCFVIGLDGHGPGVFRQVESFARELGLAEVQITIQTAFPGTRLYERLLAEGRLLEGTNWRKCTLFDVNYVPRGMTPEELRDGFRGLAVRLYDAESTRRRRENFHRCLRASRHPV